MSLEHWQRVERLFDEALERGKGERAAFLEEACADDADLRREVEELLSVAEHGDDYLEDLARRAGFGPEEADESPALHGSAPTREEHHFRAAGSYRIVRQLGRGGMGRVYLAERAGTGFKQRVALKVVKRGMDSDLVLQRFLRERRILARLQHPNIAGFFDGGLTDSGRPYFAMEYVDGRPLTEYCDALRLGIEARLRLFLEVCEALQYAHRRLVVHRDLKPTNILVSEPKGPEEGGGRVKLLDFGIAKVLQGDEEDAVEALTETGMQVMTPEYAAPEQVRGEPVTTASDVYALGVILYELLSGHRPYRIDRRSHAQIAQVISEAQPDRPSTAVGRVWEPTAADSASEQVTPESVSQARSTQADRLRRKLEGDLDTICLMALRKEPERRYHSADALGEDIKRFLAGFPVAAQRDSASYRVGKFVRRHRAGVAAVTLVITSLAVGLALALSQTQIAQGQRELARQESEKAQRALDFLVRVFEVADPRETGGKTLTAQEILAQGSQLIEAELSGQPDVQAMLHNAVARAYQSMGQLEKARLFFERSLDRSTAEHGPNHPDVAAGMSQLANLLRLEGDLETAELMLREALELQLRIHGEEDPLVATTLDHLGLLLLQTDRPDEAVQLHERALATRRRLLGAEHRDVAVSLNNVAGALGNLQRLDAAGEHYREAIVIWRAVVGPEHPDLAVAINNLARLLRMQGDLEAAEPLYREALIIWRAHYGDEHPNVAIVMGNLAALLRTRGDLDAAEPLYRQTLAIGRRTLGERHPNVAVSINNLGKLLHDKGDLEAAEASFREAVTIWRESYGEEHSRVMIGVSNLAAVLHDRGDLDAAEEHYLRALELGEKTLSEGHPRIATALSGLGRVASDRGRAEDAEPLQREALEMLEQHYGPGDERTVEAREQLARTLATLGLE